MTWYGPRTSGARRLARAGAIASAIALFGGARQVHAGQLHIVMQVEFELRFDPENVVVAQGDTIRWIWADGFHTVTSGADCMPDNIHFNAPLFSGMPVFEYTIPEDFVGEIPYYCAPHCGLGMIGNISVKEGHACAGDFDGSGIVDFGDLLQVLAAWGPCPVSPECPEDLDGDGSVRFGDIVILLGNWGPC